MTAVREGPAWGCICTVEVRGRLQFGLCLPTNGTGSGVAASLLLGVQCSERRFLASSQGCTGLCGQPMPSVGSHGLRNLKSVAAGCDGSAVRQNPQAVLKDAACLLMLLHALLSVHCVYRGWLYGHTVTCSSCLLLTV